ncbi:MAG: hypothetical protein KAI66_07690 [Lentisphaeria bacterium]|nr:hypothetical protein [Lentisphaeria bacterium]
MTDRENWLRAWRFQHPERIPVVFAIPAEMWGFYGPDLERLVVKHQMLFPGFREGSINYDNVRIDERNKQGTHVDPWGCIYESQEEGLPCYVTKHPLQDWGNLEKFTPPDPEKTNGRGAVDWERTEEHIARSKAAGGLTSGGLVHGHLFLLLQDLRGYQNLLMDMVDEHPNLPRLIAMIERFSLHIVRRYIAMGVEVMRYPEDLGCQDRPMVSPELFRTYIKPAYARLMAPAREAGVVVHMHCDGYLWDLIDDILETGVDVVNMQDVVNGIDEMARNLKGRVCIDCDIDRQSVTRFGSPKDIDDLIHEEVDKLGSAEGGLTLRHGLYSGAPLENVEAIMDAMEKYSLYYS